MTSPQPAYPPPAQQPPAPPGTGAPWHRSATDRMVAGVCGGLGRRLGVDPVILRVVVVILAFFAGAGIVLYAAAWLFMPLDQTNQSVLSDALGSNAPDRGRSILTAAALLGVLALAAIFALDGGFVPGLLIAIVILVALLIARRDETATAAPTAPPGRPEYGPAPSAGTDTGTEPTVALGSPRSTGTGAAEPTLTMPRPGSAPGPTSTPAASWDPPFDAPPSPPYGSGQLPPPPSRRARSYLGVLTVSAMIAVLGALGVVDLSGVAVPVTAYVVAALAVVAGGLVLGAWVGRSRGLIALGILLGLAIAPAVVFDAVAGPNWRDWSNADDVRLAPRTPDELAPAYEYGAGSIRMDLTELDFEGEDLSTMIDMGAGEVVITVPPDVDVVVDAAVAIGDLTVFDRRSSGFDAGDAFTDTGPDGSGGGRLDVSIDLGLGKVEVRRATS